MRRMKCAVMCAALVAGICCVAEKPKKLNVNELIRPATELISAAQQSYVDGDSKRALELYRKAYEKLLEVELEYFEQAATAEFTALRSRKALCERVINNIMLEDAQTFTRTMTVTDTRALEKKRDERKKAEDPEETATIKLGSKGGEGGDPAKGGGANERVQIDEELEWAKDMIQFERFAEAEQSLIKVLRVEPEHREARFLMALSRVRQGRGADALVILDGLLDDNASDESALLLAGGAYMATGAYSKAVDALDKAGKVNPKRPDAQINMAWLLLEMRPTETAEAEEYYRLAVKRGASRVRELEKRLGIKQEQ